MGRETEGGRADQLEELIGQGRVLLQQGFQFIGIGVACHQLQQLQQARTGNGIFLRQAAVGMQGIVTREPAETFHTACIKLNGIAHVLGQVRATQAVQPLPCFRQVPHPGVQRHRFDKGKNARALRRQAIGDDGEAAAVEPVQRIDLARVHTMLHRHAQCELALRDLLPEFRREDRRITHRDDAAQSAQCVMQIKFIEQARQQGVVVFDRR